MFESVALSLLALAALPASKAAEASASWYTGPSTEVLGPVGELTIANKIIAPDGFNRSATLANGAYPGPLIIANKSDRFSFKIINQLTDDTMPLETSVHWHGIAQYRTNWADGTDEVTQCPINQGKDFTAKFDSFNETGTYWYHSHHGAQFCDGLRGPLIIYDPEDPQAALYDVDDASTVLTLSDWYHRPSTVLAEIGGRVIPNATLINGRGRYPTGPAVPLSVIDVEPNQRYRFRLIGMACSSDFNFTIDGHRMTVIEVEGTPVNPVEVDSLRIYPGQRYSVVVTADQLPGTNYWVRALSSFDDYPDKNFTDNFPGNASMAILRYKGAPDDYPESTPGPFQLVLDETTLHPIPAAEVPDVSGTPDTGIQFFMKLDIPNKTYYINNVTFPHTPGTTPDEPVLLQILRGTPPDQLLPKGSIYELFRNTLVELSFPDPYEAGIGKAIHPMHLHGHKFAVVRSAGSNATNLVNPVWRDTVFAGVGKTDNMTIRFRTDNPGPWILHCHVDWHLIEGLAVVMAEMVNQTSKEVHPPADWKALCQKN